MYKQHIFIYRLQQTALAPRCLLTFLKTGETALPSYDENFTLKVKDNCVYFFLIIKSQLFQMLPLGNIHIANHKINILMRYIHMLVELSRRDEKS